MTETLIYNLINFDEAENIDLVVENKNICMAILVATCALLHITFTNFYLLSHSFTYFHYNIDQYRIWKKIYTYITPI